MFGPSPIIGLRFKLVVGCERLIETPTFAYVKGATLYSNLEATEPACKTVRGYCTD